MPLRTLCRLCPHSEPVSRARAWYAAVDHLLDEHRAHVLRAPAQLPARALISITRPRVPQEA